MVQKGKCCCEKRVWTKDAEEEKIVQKVQDVRIATTQCKLEQLKKYHAAGMIKGELTTLEGPKITGLRSSKVADISIPAEADASKRCQ